MIDIKYIDFHCVDAAYLVLFCGLLLRSSELVFRRLHRSRHRGFEVAIPPPQMGGNRLVVLITTVPNLFNAEWQKCWSMES